MIKFNFIILIHLIIFLKIQCAGKPIHVEVKIKDNWEEKREFIYLKNVEIKDRFVVKVIAKNNNQHDGLTKNIEGYLRSIDINLDKNMYEVELSDRSEYIPSDQLKRKILIEITNNEIIQNFLTGFEKMVLRNNNFIENNNCYETSILYKSEKNFKLIEASIESYKNNLLSSYWTEMNLIGYKIELLERQKLEYPKTELKSRIIYIGSEIKLHIQNGGILYSKNITCARNVANIKTNMESLDQMIYYLRLKRVTHTKRWYTLLEEHYLCKKCGEYKNKYGKFRSNDLLFKTKKVIF
uniref:Uncharacterized protein n=1 Tax=Meloidogyne enterolobii TaxID=390850 RepID=A0A6V7W573_MELEN|nr:unnamed protein product [Meloidogyne enterolobii]